MPQTHLSLFVSSLLNGSMSQTSTGLSWCVTLINAEIKTLHIYNCTTSIQINNRLLRLWKNNDTFIYQSSNLISTTVCNAATLRVSRPFTYGIFHFSLCFGYSVWCMNTIHIIWSWSVCIYLSKMSNLWNIIWKVGEWDLSLIICDQNMMVCDIMSSYIESTDKHIGYADAMLLHAVLQLYLWAHTFHWRSWLFHVRDT